ncbi:unnamed protein product [Calypogeia fissa]
MNAGDGDVALLWANVRIKELESTVAALQEKIKVLEIKNSKLAGLLASSEDFSKITCSLPEVSGCKETELKLDIQVEGKRSENGLTSTREPLVLDNTGSGVEMDSSIQVQADDRLRSTPSSADLCREQNVLELTPQKTFAAQKDPNVRMPLRRQSHYGAPVTSEDATESQVGHVSRKARKGNRSLQDQPTRHVALRIMYLGSSYHGFASQGASEKTVEAELFAALEHTKLLIGERADAKYSRCGRTDKGVSAIGQVIALELRSKLKTPPAQESRDGELLINHDLADLKAEEFSRDRVAAARASRDLEESVSSSIGTEDEIDYVGVLNRVLPEDIRVLGWCPVPRDFSARFSCLYREYKYFFINTNLDIEAMKIAGAKFLGDHDFRNFCKMDAANVHNFRRTISIFEILPVNERWAGKQVWVMRIRGTAFLWHQIRCMAAALFMVGQRNEPPSIVEDLLNVGKVPRKPQYIMASELPLVLHTCGFQGLTLHCPSRAAKHLQVHLNNIMDETVLKLALLQEAIAETPISNMEEDITVKKQHAPLLGRLTEPSYEERRARKIV